MHFGLSEEQQQFRDSLQRFFADTYAFDHRRAIAASERGSDDAIWQQLAELGALAIAVPEDRGGLGGGHGELMLVMEEIGRALVLEPYLGTVVIGGSLLARAGSPAQRTLLTALAEGKQRLALAHYEPGARYELDMVATRAERSAAGWTLSGAKTFVLQGATADTLIVSARTAAAASPGAGISVFLVPRDAPGLSVEDYRMHDGQRAAQLRLNAVRVPPEALLGTQGQGHALLEYAVDLANAALCAEAVGAMSVLLDQTLAYLKTRRQFGVPIGSFQALQHRMADMLLNLEQARSMAWLASSSLDDPSPAVRRRQVAAAKAVVGQAARFVGQQAVQLHGGIGVTDELAVSHYFRRLTMIIASFGDTDHQLGIVSDGLLEDSRSVETPARASAAG